MKDTISVQASIDLPLSVIVEAVGPEVTRALISSAGPAAIRKRPTFTALIQAVDRVVSALNTLEKNANSVGEAGAREQLMNAVANLRAVRTKHRSI